MGHRAELKRPGGATVGGMGRILLMRGHRVQGFSACFGWSSYRGNAGEIKDLLV